MVRIVAAALEIIGSKRIISLSCFKLTLLDLFVLSFVVHHLLYRATSNREDFVRQSLSCLAWLQNLYHAGDKAACLDRIKYSTCISSFVRTKHLPEAQALLFKMLDDFKSGNQAAKPDSRNFSMVINGWTGWPNFDHMHLRSGLKAEILMRLMWTLSDNKTLEGVRPTPVMYTRIINCLVLTSQPTRAEQLLREFDTLYKQRRLSHGPSHRTFQVVVQAWQQSRTSQSGKYNHAHALQAEMKRRFYNPSKNKDWDIEEYRHCNSNNSSNKANKN